MLTTMKARCNILICMVLACSSVFWIFTNGQLFEDPTKNFEIFQMDWINRGDFNISSCLTDLINCWEIMRGDVICSRGKFYETVCGLNRNYCHDVFGDYDSYLRWFEYTLFESVCQDWEHEQYT